LLQLEIPRRNPGFRPRSRQPLAPRKQQEHNGTLFAKEGALWTPSGTLFWKDWVMSRFVASIVAVLALIVLASAAAKADEVAIAVSPSTVNVQWPGQCVTVHAVIAYGSVDKDESVTLTIRGEVITATGTSADSRGELVAKFDVVKVKDILADVEKPCQVEMTLAGLTTDGEDFSGTDTVRVIDVSGRN
jgi:hypothetical protein